MAAPLSFAEQFVRFVNRSPTPFHAVEQCRQRLLQSGFVQVSEKEPWTVRQGGRYFFTRNQSSLVCFAVGGKFTPGQGGFKVVAGHTDSPNLRVKHNSAVSRSGFLQLSVETYGGGLWHTWFDRDLSIAGRVIVKSEGGKFEHKLVRIDDPILRVPTLAIHLDRSVADGFSFNKENHLAPILCTEIQNKLSSPAPAEASSSSAAAAAAAPAAGSGVANHHPVLVKLLADQLKVQPQDLIEFELSLYDTQPATIGGLHKEFIFAPRIDNLMSCFGGLESMLKTCSDESLATDPDVRVVAMFDHEEVGSESAQGAASAMMEDFFHRICTLMSSPETARDAFEASMKKSFLISADMAHGVHPNYSEKHHELHRPEIHKGVTIKINSNQRYATNGITSFLLKELGRRNSIPIQSFMVRNDCLCGSTIGPIMSARCGIRTVDVGLAQLSMHSIREACGVHDVDHYVNLFGHFFEQFHTLDESLYVE